MIQPTIQKPARTIRLVMIENYKLVRVGLRMALGMDDCFQIVGEGGSGLQGLHLLQTLSPDVVLLDLGLPDMDGLEVAREIRRMDANVKILALTSLEGEDMVLQVLSCGVNAYCLKDIGAERLVEVIKSVFDGAVWLDPRVASCALRIFSDGVERRCRQARLALSQRDREVLRLLTEGKSNVQIARILDISLHASKILVGGVLQKLCVPDRAQAAVQAVRQNLI